MRERGGSGTAAGCAAVWLALRHMGAEAAAMGFVTRAALLQAIAMRRAIGGVRAF